MYIIDVLIQIKQ